MPNRAPALLLAFALTALACSATEDSAPKAVPTWEKAGAHAVGHTVLALEDASRGRKLNLHLWYPTEAEALADESRIPVAELVPEGEDRDTLASLVADAPERCTRKLTGPVSPESPMAGSGRLPLVVFSHCHGCLGIFSFGIAERLSSHGFVVAAPDHPGDTLFESLEGTNAPLDGEFLSLRAGDIRFVLDTLLDAEAEVLPERLRNRFDEERVGAFGHSYGAATTGLVLQEDARVKAGFAIAAPMESPLLRGPKMVDIDRPVAFLLAREDNSITEIGNAYIRANFEAAKKDAWLFEVADAGHWSFSDLCAVTDKFRAGCGEGKRHEGRADFTYLDNDSAREIGAAYVTAFMAAMLDGAPEARAYLDAPDTEGIVTTRN